jgi:2-polyprenyl-3-methyl-5-hydroxy-6-metoxy-1,4-benzoquinol methylase
MSASDFYDAMTPFYHLIYPNWEESISRQAALLDAIIHDYWGNAAHSILDVSCGIGTQSLGLAQLGYQLTASDLSAASISRAQAEAQKRRLAIRFSVADMRQAFRHHAQQFDLVISCDNAVPHLLSDDDIRQALQQFYQCTRPGGGSLISVRPYEQEMRTGVRSSLTACGTTRVHDISSFRSASGMARIMMSPCTSWKISGVRRVRSRSRAANIMPYRSTAF